MIGIGGCKVLIGFEKGSGVEMIFGRVKVVWKGLKLKR